MNDGLKTAIVQTETPTTEKSSWVVGAVGLVIVLGVLFIILNGLAWYWNTVIQPSLGQPMDAGHIAALWVFLTVLVAPYVWWARR